MSDLYRLNVDASGERQGRGVVSIGVTRKTVVTNDVALTSEVSVGDFITVETSHGRETRTVSSVDTDHQITVSQEFNGTAIDVIYWITNALNSYSLRVLPNGNVRFSGSADQFTPKNQPLVSLSPNLTYPEAKRFTAFFCNPVVNFTAASGNTLFGGTTSVTVGSSNVGDVQVISQTAGVAVANGAKGNLTVHAFGTPVAHQSATALVSGYCAQFWAPQLNSAPFGDWSHVRIGPLPSNPTPRNGACLLIGTVAQPQGQWATYSDSVDPSFFRGPVKLQTGLQIKEGDNARMGAATMVNGTVKVANTTVTAKSRIFPAINSPMGDVGSIYIVKDPGIGFTIHSTSLTDQSEVAWLIVEPIV